MTGMAVMGVFKGAIQARAMDVLVEGWVIDSFVDTGPTLGAFEVAFSLFKVMLGCLWGCVDLLL